MWQVQLDNFFRVWQYSLVHFKTFLFLFCYSLRNIVQFSKYTDNSQRPEQRTFLFWGCYTGSIFSWPAASRLEAANTTRINKMYRSHGAASHHHTPDVKAFKSCFYINQPQGVRIGHQLICLSGHLFDQPFVRLAICSTGHLGYIRQLGYGVNIPLLLWCPLQPSGSALDVIRVWH